MSKAEPGLCFISGEEDLTDTDSVKTGADSPELADFVPDKDNLRYIKHPQSRIFLFFFLTLLYP